MTLWEKIKQVLFADGAKPPVQERVRPWRAGYAVPRYIENELAIDDVQITPPAPRGTLYAKYEPIFVAPPAPRGTGLTLDMWAGDEPEALSGIELSTPIKVIGVAAVGLLLYSMMSKPTSKPRKRAKAIL